MLYLDSIKWFPRKLYNKDQTKILFIPSQSQQKDLPVYAIYEDSELKKIIIVNDPKFDSNDFFVAIRDFCFGISNHEVEKKFEDTKTQKKSDQFINKHPFAQR